MVSVLGARDEADVAEIRRSLPDVSTPLISDGDLDPIIELIDDARFVLLGEATHGTSEFYAWRARITQRLIREKGFSLIAVEGDWPDCFRVNQYVKSRSDDASAYDVLNAFSRWPTWMWANTEMVHLAEWLRGWNDNLSEEDQVGFYGLDVYSLWESIDAVIRHLRNVDPRLAASTAAAYGCFDPYLRDEHAYARATVGRFTGHWGRGLPHNCQDEVVDALRRIRERHAKGDLRQDDDGRIDPEAAFDAEQNALCVVNAERYYRTMVKGWGGDAESWNVRDIHMADTLDRLMAFQRTMRDTPKAIVWAHNTHLGDARATDMAAEGMINLGQLVRERHRAQGVRIVGFSSHHGSVIAGRGWGEPMERMPVPEAAERSWENILHDPEAPNPPARTIIMEKVRNRDEWMTSRGHRAIGVVYHPRHERPGNYVPTILPERYDALIACDETHALHPLHTARADLAEIPETFPTGA